MCSDPPQKLTAQRTGVMLLQVAFPASIKIIAIIYLVVMGQETDFAECSLLRWLSVWVLVRKMYIWSCGLLISFIYTRITSEAIYPRTLLPPSSRSTCVLAKLCALFASNFLCVASVISGTGLLGYYTNTQRELYSMFVVKFYLHILAIPTYFTESVWRPVKTLLCVLGMHCE